MAVLSVLQVLASNQTPSFSPYPLQASLLKYYRFKLVRNMSDVKVMKILPSRASWNKFKDLFNFYVLLGVIPCSALILCVNLFVGPARLAPTPEGYVPQHWEYYSHPITRFLAKYTTRSYQEEYEISLHHLYEEEYKQKLRLAEDRVRTQMDENQDSQAYYYVPESGRYQRFVREEKENIALSEGRK
nr:EOG090X0FIE [Sida crystallina]